MGHECPSDTEHAWVSLQMPGSQFWQFFIKSNRQVVTNFAKLLFDNVKVIDQPLRGGRDRMLFLNGLRSGAVIFQQDSAVFGYARDKRATVVGIGRDGLSGGKTFRVLLQTLNAEQFRANRLVNFDEYILGLSGRGHLSLEIVFVTTNRCALEAYIQYNANSKSGHSKAIEDA